MGFEAGIEGAEKWAALTVEVLPGVLTVQNHEDGGFAVAARTESIAGVSEFPDEVVGSAFGGP
jgi:hypothetical protein